MRAQSWARTQLTHQYPDEHLRNYRDYLAALIYEGEDKNKARSRASSYSKTRLVKAHPVAYRLLYLEAVLQYNHSRNHRKKRGG